MWQNRVFFTLRQHPVGNNITMPTPQKRTKPWLAIVAIVAAIAITAMIIAVFVGKYDSPSDGTAESTTQSTTNGGSTDTPAATIEGSDVTWIGDSVSAGLTSDTLKKRFPGVHLDVQVGKSFRTLSQDISDLEGSGNLKSTVVVALGVNGGADEGTMEEIMEQLGQDRQVVLVYPGTSSNQDTIEVFNALAEEFPDQVETVDWPGESSKVKDFADDGVHIGEQGANVLADVVAPKIASAQKNLK